jgi:hypothetical protein
VKIRVIRGEFTTLLYARYFYKDRTFFENMNSSRLFFKVLMLMDSIKNAPMESTDAFLFFNFQLLQ